MTNTNKTLAQQFNKILTEETVAFLWGDNDMSDRLKADRLAFKKKYCIAFGNAHIGTWKSLTLVFVDGSVYINSKSVVGYHTFS